jgi:hypothetical protein
VSQQELDLFQFATGRVTEPSAQPSSETIENPASNFRRLDGRDDFHGRYSAGIAAREVGEVT